MLNLKHEFSNYIILVSNDFLIEKNSSELAPGLPFFAFVFRNSGGTECQEFLYLHLSRVSCVYANETELEEVENKYEPF